MVYINSWLPIRRYCKNSSTALALSTLKCGVESFWMHYSYCINYKVPTNQPFSWVQLNAVSFSATQTVPR